MLKAIAYAPKSSAETERATATPRAKFVRLESAWSATPHPNRIAVPSSHHGWESLLAGQGASAPLFQTPGGTASPDAARELHL